MTSRLYVYTVIIDNIDMEMSGSTTIPETCSLPVKDKRISFPYIGSNVPP